jgi:hypothetical protein
VEALGHAHVAVALAVSLVLLDAQGPEVVGAVDDGLDAQDAPLVIALDPVLSDAVLDASAVGAAPAFLGGVSARGEARVRAGDLGLAGLELEAQEADDIVGGEGPDGVVEEVATSQASMAQ